MKSHCSPNARGRRHHIASTSLEQFKPPAGAINDSPPRREQNWPTGNRRSQSLDLTLLRMRLVSFDNHLHQLVPDHVLVTEVDEVDPINASQDAFGLN